MLDMWCRRQLFDHCHITENYWGSAHRSCNINLRLTKKVPVIFHNLKSFDSHLVIRGILTLDVKVILNVLEKYMAFTIGNNFVFIDSIQFTNFSLDALVKNLSYNDFNFYRKNLAVIC